MKDACVESCLQKTSDQPPHRRQLSHHRHLSEANTTTTVKVGMPTWSMGSTDPFSRCMQKQCSATEPTNYNPEVFMPIFILYFVCVEKVLLVLKLVSIRFCLDLLYSFMFSVFFFSGRW